MEELCFTRRPYIRLLYDVLLVFLLFYCVYVCTLCNFVSSILCILSILCIFVFLCDILLPSARAAQPGSVGGQCPPLLGPAGYRGYSGRSNENYLCFYSRQSLFRTVQANFNIFNRPLLIVTCLYPHIWKYPALLQNIPC